MRPSSFAILSLLVVLGLGASPVVAALPSVRETSSSPIKKHASSATTLPAAPTLASSSAASALPPG